MINLERLIDFEKLSYNWKKIERIDEFAVLKKCEQNPRWHSEGNAWKHTQLVCEEMVKILKSRGFKATSSVTDSTKVLMTAALFHDIGKGVTTEFKKGNWHAYGHEIQGERITRLLLWDEDINFREAVCSLVRWHMDPLRIFENGSKDYIEKVLRLKKVCDLSLLIILKMADVAGSIQQDIASKDTDMEKLKFLENINSQIPNSLPLPGTLPWENLKKVVVVMMIGLPGAGKDTYIKKEVELEGLTVTVCRDDIRAELGFCKNGEKIVGTRYQEDKVSKVFNDRVVEAAENNKMIVINNINLKKGYRDDIHELLKKYNPWYTYIYVQADSLEKNYMRRHGQIDEEVFDKMIMSFDWPYAPEYDEMKIVTN